MKLIDLLNKIANREEAPKKILIRDVVYYLIHDTDGNKIYSQTIDEKNWESFIDHRLNITRCLNEEVIILENEQIEDEEIDIQEIDIKTLSNRKLLEVIVRVVKQIDKKLKEKE